MKTSLLQGISFGVYPFGSTCTFAKIIDLRNLSIDHNIITAIQSKIKQLLSKILACEHRWRQEIARNMSAFERLPVY